LEVDQLSDRAQNFQPCSPHTVLHSGKRNCQSEFPVVSFAFPNRA